MNDRELPPSDRADHEELTPEERLQIARGLPVSVTEAEARRSEPTFKRLDRMARQLHPKLMAKADARAPMGPAKPRGDGMARIDRIMAGESPDRQPGEDDA